MESQTISQDLINAMDSIRFLFYFLLLLLFLMLKSRESRESKEERKLPYWMRDPKVVAAERVQHSKQIQAKKVRGR